MPLVTIPIAHSRRLQPVAAAPLSAAGVALLAIAGDAADGAGSRRVTTASAIDDATSVVTVRMSATSRS